MVLQHYMVTCQPEFSENLDTQQAGPRKPIKILAVFMNLYLYSACIRFHVYMISHKLCHAFHALSITLLDNKTTLSSGVDPEEGYWVLSLSPSHLSYI